MTTAPEAGWQENRHLLRDGAMVTNCRRISPNKLTHEEVVSLCRAILSG